MTPKVFRLNDNELVISNNGNINKIVVNLSNKLKNNTFRNLTYMLNIKAIKKPIFLIPNVKKTFNYLNKAFIKTLIF